MWVVKDSAPTAASRYIVVLLLAQYSTNIALCDFYLFQQMKAWLKDIHFQEAEKVQVTSKIALQEFPCAGLQKPSEQLYECWGKCIAEGNYRLFSTATFQVWLYGHFLSYHEQ